MEQNFELKVDINGINIWFFVNLGIKYYKPSKKTSDLIFISFTFPNQHKNKDEINKF